MGAVLTTCSSWIGCGAVPEKDEELAQIERKRACTDVLCCGLFLAFFAAMMGMWMWAVAEGDIFRLLGGYDYEGNTCMANDDKPYTMYPFADAATNLYFLDVGVCTSDCANTNELSAGLYPLVTPLYFSGPYDSQPVGGRCLSPTEDMVTDITTSVGDLRDAMAVVGGSAGIAFALVAIFCVLTKFFAAAIVYGTIGSVLVSGVLAGFFCYDKSLAENTETGEIDELMQYVSFGIWGFTAIVLLLVVFFRKNIKIAVEVLKSASRALNDMSGMFFFPIVPFVIGLVFFLLWCSATALLFSMGEMTDVEMPEVLQGKTVNDGDMDITFGSTYKELTYDQNLQNMLWANLFFMFWFMNFLIFFTYTTLSGAVADWYFTRRDENGNKPRGSEEGQLTKWPVLSAFWRTLRYHCGTIAFGALIIALIQLARAMVAYAQKQLEKQNNAVAKYALAALQCCLWCFEKCMKFIGKNALIFTAIYGKPFCPSAKASFVLVWANLARVGIMKLISGCITLLGKAFTVAGTCMISYILLTQSEPYKTEVQNLFFPGLIIFLLSWLVAVVFMMVFDTAIDTVFMCYLVDIEHNQQGNMLADEGLRRIVQKYEAESKAYAENNKSAAGVEPEDES